MQSGEYISFIDADDYIVDNYIETLYKATENKTIEYVKCLMMNRKKIEITEKLYIKEDGDFEEIYNLILNTYQLSSVCCGLIKNEILKNNKIMFKEEYNYAEDYLFNIEIFKNISTFKYINHKGYYYRENQESLTRKFDSKKLVDTVNMAIKAYKELYELFPNDKDKVDNRIEKEILHILDSLFYATTKTKPKQRIEIYIKINEILKKEDDIFKSHDLMLLNHKHYILYDIKNNILKKFPRKIKHIIK